MKTLWEKSTIYDGDSDKDLKIEKLMNDKKLREQYSDDVELMRADILKRHPELKTSDDYNYDFFVEASKVSESLLGEYADERVEIAYDKYSPKARRILENIIYSSVLDVNFDDDKKK